MNLPACIVPQDTDEESYEQCENEAKAVMEAQRPGFHAIVLVIYFPNIDMVNQSLLCHTGEYI